MSLQEFCSAVSILELCQFTIRKAVALRSWHFCHCFQEPVCLAGAGGQSEIYMDLRILHFSMSHNSREKKVSNSPYLKGPASLLVGVFRTREIPRKKTRPNKQCESCIYLSSWWIFSSLRVARVAQLVGVVSWSGWSCGLGGPGGPGGVWTKCQPDKMPT